MMTTVKPSEIQAFLKSVKKGDLEAVKQFLAKGIEPDSVDKEGMTALMLATNQGHPDIVRALIEAKANVNTTNKEGSTALMLASFHGYTEIVRILIKDGANVAPRDSSSTALIGAALSGHTPVARILIEAGAKADAKNKNGMTALMVASGRGHAEFVRYLIELGANINAKDNDGENALVMATNMGQAEIVQILSNAGANLEQTSDITSGHSATQTRDRPATSQILDLLTYLIPAIIFALVTYFLSSRDAKWEASATQTEGIVVAAGIKPSVRFTLGSGSPVEVAVNTWSSTEHKLDEKVTILYKPEASVDNANTPPSDVRILGDRTSEVVIGYLVTFVFVVITGVKMLLNSFKNLDQAIRK